MRGHDRPKELKWVLDYHMPGSRHVEPLRISEGDEDPEEPGPAADGSTLVEQQLGLYGPGEVGRWPLGAEMVRCSGDDLLSIELVRPGEQQRSLGAGGTKVEVDRLGRCFVSVADPAASVAVASGPGHRRPVGAPVEGYEVPWTGQAVVRCGAATLFIRPVVAGPPKGQRVRVAALFAGLFLALALVLVLVSW
jgi:hypothetical protein